MGKTPKPSRIKAHLGQTKMRLSSADRAFLKDLSRVSVVDGRTANQYHYLSSKGDATKRLDKLVDYGLLSKSRVVEHDGKVSTAYQFADNRVAKSFGGALPSTGINRTMNHELMVSRLYFSNGRPVDFRTTGRFSLDDYKMLGANPPSFSTQTTHHAIVGDSAIPDALFTSSEGEVVIVEADSGHYTTRQIAFKQERWSGFRQVWGQPFNPHARVQTTDTVAVHTF